MKIFSWLLTFLFALLSIISIGDARPRKEDTNFGPEPGRARLERGKMVKQDFGLSKMPEKETPAAKPKRDRNISSFKIH